ncbi:MAG: hypothetical protein FJW30_30535 [Acidobacteria bacterium]|nr:hypothetical protein [Acidobacteriota bacterium]
MPAPIVDGNSPGVWVDGVLQVYTSTGGERFMMTGASVESLQMASSPTVDSSAHFPMWIEAIWRDEDGSIYAWYHNEQVGLCGGKMAAPRIGALLSTDGGKHFTDLGIVLRSGDGINCSAQNGFFAGGHGDFSVILDQEKKHFYFLFTNYTGPAHTQGVAMARMAFEDRAHPEGAVYKYHNGEWKQPGLDGALTPVLPAARAWDYAESNSFWGAAVHWNYEIQRYVVIMNHACCKKEWPQEGIYMAFIGDLSSPSSWTTPVKILDASQIGFAPGYYPQIWGTGAFETDTIAGKSARLFIKGRSSWRMEFTQSPPPVEPEPEPEPEP